VAPEAGSDLFQLFIERLSNDQAAQRDKIQEIDNDMASFREMAFRLDRAITRLEDTVDTLAKKSDQNSKYVYIGLGVCLAMSVVAPLLFQKFYL